MTNQRRIADSPSTIARLVSLCALAMCGACAVTPPGPRGPLLGRGISIASDVSYAASRGQATAVPGYSTGGRTDTFTPWGADGPLTSGGLEGRISPIRWFDVGGQVSLTGGGLDVRAGLPVLEGMPIAANVAAGFETGDVSFFNDTKLRRSRWLRLEVYPRLPVAWNAWLVLAVGYDSGNFYREVPNRPPHVYDSLPSLRVMRRESRLETSIGAFVKSAGPRAGSILLSVNPYFVLDAGPPTGPCTNCVSDVTAYRQQWGLVVVARYAFHLGF